jgi:hypothetical protein
MIHLADLYLLGFEFTVNVLYIHIPDFQVLIMWVILECNGYLVNVLSKVEKRAEN